jgi:hypothetical protein
MDNLNPTTYYTSLLIVHFCTTNGIRLRQYEYDGDSYICLFIDNDFSRSETNVDMCASNIVFKATKSDCDKFIIWRTQINNLNPTLLRDTLTLLRNFTSNLII